MRRIFPRMCGTPPSRFPNCARVFWMFIPKRWNWSIAAISKPPLPTLKQDCELRLEPIDGMRAPDPDEASRDAELYAAAAAIDQLNLDHRAAAEKYAAAARLVSNAAETVGSRPPAPGRRGAFVWRRRARSSRMARGAGRAIASSARSRAMTARSTPCPARNRPSPGRRRSFIAPTRCSPPGSTTMRRAASRKQLAPISSRLRNGRMTPAPFEWARAQHNLGDALQRLAEMEDGFERLRPARKPIAPLSSAWTQRAAPESLRHGAGQSWRRARHHGRAHRRRGAAARGDLRLSGRARRIAAGYCAAGMGAHAK